MLHYTTLPHSGKILSVQNMSFSGGRNDISLLPHSTFTQKPLVITGITRDWSSHETLHHRNTPSDLQTRCNLHASQLSLRRNVEWQLKVEAFNKAYLLSTIPLINRNKLIISIFWHSKGHPQVQPKKKSCKSLSQTDDNCREAKSQWIKKVLQRIAVLQPSFHTLESTKET